jgi:hypothetical protein
MKCKPDIAVIYCNNINATVDTKHDFVEELQ